MPEIQHLHPAIIQSHDQQKHRYEKLYQLFKNAPQSLHFISQYSQIIRFLQFLKLGDIHSKKILDLGCGLGDFFRFLEEQGIKIRKAVKETLSCLTNEELEDLLEILKSDSVDLELSNKWSKRQREYQEIIKNGSIFDLTRILKNLSEIQQQKELSYSEKKIFENVKKMIISEIAHVKKIEQTKAEKMIDALL